MNPGTYHGGFLRTAGGLAGFVLNPLLRRLFPEPRRPVTVRKYHIQARWWPSRLDGYRIAFASDLHLQSGGTTREILRNVVDELQGCAADLILLGGDFNNSLLLATNFPAAEYAEGLARLDAPDGVYAVMGNHDLRFKPKRLAKILRFAGIRHLDDRCVRIRTRGGSFRLAGFSWPGPGRKKIRKILPGKKCDEPIICLAHVPHLFPRLPRRARLLFAGHTHGGQVRLPGIGPVVKGTVLPRRCNHGITRAGGRTLLVTSGVGCSTFDVRLGCPPEVVCVTLNHFNGGESCPV